jgi:anti-sigma regulatory factor (Ser/Thr protein kinase)/predicted transcriptional regulator
MAEAFYPFVGDGGEKAAAGALDEARWPARIAVYDDAAAAPRVVVVEPKDTRSYLEEITSTVNSLAREQGGRIPFTVIREIVENFIHAYFMAPTISILDEGNTIRFSDQGPGISEKRLALEYGTTSATEEMKRYIRGVGSGLPYVQQYMLDKGGSLTIEDNIAGGAVVTISTRPEDVAAQVTRPAAGETTAPDGTEARATPAVPAQHQLSERARTILAFLAERGVCGPTDLTRAYGLSSPTWSRELSSLVKAGAIMKQGQKYVLTDFGRSLT